MSAERAGVDAIVAEGSESGGMTSMEQISTLVLVPQVAEAVGCPVIASRTGGIPDMIKDGRNGLLVRPGAVRELANALRRVRDPA